MILFSELEQTIQKFICNHKRTRIAKAILRGRRERRRRHNSPRLQTILQSYSNQDSVVLIQKQTYGPTEHKSRPRYKPRHLMSINLRQRRQEHKMGRSLFSKWCQENWTAACRPIKPEHSLTPCTQLNSKWLKDLNIRYDTIKLLEENRGKTF